MAEITKKSDVRATLQLPSKKDAEILQSCMICGEKKTDNQFYSNKYSKMWIPNKYIVPYCKRCIQEIYDENKERYDAEIATIIICHYLDLPFSKDSFLSHHTKDPNFAIGSYISALNLKNAKFKTFAHSIIEDEIGRTYADVREDKEVKWRKRDKANRDLVISTVGFDPFDLDSLSDGDRQFCFNLMAGYCDIQDLKSDQYKLNGVIELVLNQCQLKEINEKIHSALATKQTDEKTISTLMGIKDKLSKSISSIAKENQISSLHQSNKSQPLTLSGKMKEMEENGFEKIFVNAFTIETADAMKQIADLSNRSIMEQLAFDAGDYADMVKKQREMIVKLQRDLDDATETLRLAKNQLARMGADSIEQEVVT